MLPIRKIPYLLPICCSFWEKCINSPKTGLGCSTPLKHFFLPIFVWNILSRRLPSSPSQIFEVSLKLTKKGVSKHSCDLSIRDRQDSYYTVQWLDSDKKFEYNTTKSRFWGKLPLFKVISERCRTLLMYTIFDIFWQWWKKHCWPEVSKLKNSARHYNLAKPWLDTSLKRHLRHISINFRCDLYVKKINSDYQRAKHVCPF